MKAIAILVILTISVFLAEVVMAAGGQSGHGQVARLPPLEVPSIYVNGEKPIASMQLPLFPVLNKLFLMVVGLEAPFTKDDWGWQDTRPAAQPISASNRKLSGFSLNGSIDSPALLFTWDW